MSSCSIPPLSFYFILALNNKYTIMIFLATKSVSQQLNLMNRFRFNLNTRDISVLIKSKEAYPTTPKINCGGFKMYI